ncbi:D2013.10 [Schistosoma mansoni]|uniref:D2013.10 n=1 Tax=Schistosoma mansoni TaxID=6183 RepID=UPI0001A63262|nr:D2013.10 [Schistosoma mansoni]|eukprot:XP_018645362.1 D2013.10 [Schistosoma mansoni]
MELVRGLKLKFCEELFESTDCSLEHRRHSGRHLMIYTTFNTPGHLEYLRRFGGNTRRSGPLQSFMIPGSVVCVILLGYLFPFPVAVIIVALCSAIGASLCYLLVGFIGSKVLMYFIPEKIELCRQTIQRYRHAMFFCICCLRICPFIPNWLVNISSPIIDIPLVHFFFGTFVVVPLSLVFIKAGTVLQELTDLGVTSLASFSTLIILAGLSLLPLVFRNQLREAFL